MSIENYSAGKSEELIEEAEMAIDTLKEYTRGHNTLNTIKTLKIVYDLVYNFHGTTEGVSETREVLDGQFGMRLKEVILLFKKSGISKDCENMLRPENISVTKKELAATNYPMGMFLKLLTETKAAVMRAEIYVASIVKAK